MLGWKDVVKTEEKSRKKLETLVRGIYKTYGKSVPYNRVHEVEKAIKRKGYWESYGLKIVPIKEKVIYKYICDDEEEKKEIIKDANVDHIEELEVFINDTITTDYILEGDSELFNVVTSQEAAELIGITEGAIRKAIKSGRLKLGIDYRKAGRITLIKKSSLNIFNKQ